MPTHRPEHFRCPECEGEVFRYGHYLWDVSEAWQRIRDGMAVPLVALDVAPYAEQMLELTREGGGGFRTKRSLYTIGVDLARVRALPQDVLDIPGLVVHVCLSSGKTVPVVIDGNHRLARRYLDGVEQMFFYVFEEGQDRDEAFLLRSPPRRKCKD